MCFYGVGRDFFTSNLLLNKTLIFYSLSITQCISESVKKFHKPFCYSGFILFVLLGIYLIIFCWCAAYSFRSIDVITLLWSNEGRLHRGRPMSKLQPSLVAPKWTWLKCQCLKTNKIC
jgi:hypothetical protein